ncbi:MAG: DUF4037 domain-containing protein [Parcubacteria group bacterium]|nr:DUF4037 domain-containing protein [Parcubacteria group bacterium]
MAEFLSGIELSRSYYQEVVKPILDSEFPNLKYSAALIGWGSEVLGYDTEISRDHHWGPRVLIFLSEADFPELKEKISKTLSEKLPYEFMGYSTNFSKSQENGVRISKTITSGPVDHMVDIFTIKSLWQMRIKFDPYQEITNLDWLTFPQQRLLALTSGAVYHDGLSELETIRNKFNFYPKEVWLYLLAAQWTRISQEEAFVGRTGDVGDELGSQVVASRIVRELMKLCFLMDQKYYPYTKWFGTAFSKLNIASKLEPSLSKTLLASSWKEREKYLAEAYKIIAQAHNELGITKPMTTEVSSYHERPYLVIHADGFADAIRKTITEEELKKLPNIGSVDQFIDSSDVLEDPKLCKKTKSLYE